MNNDRFKFRVWDKENESYQQEDADWCFIKFDGTIDCGVSSDFDTVPEWHLKQENAIIEQCTGQKDQSGKLVYEGDIVEQYSPMEDCDRRCVVVWEDGPGGGYVCRYLDGKGSSGCFLASSEETYFEGSYCRIVGNIHEVNHD